MFAIYNTQGRTFRDRLEALKKVKQPQQVADIPLKQDLSYDETNIIQGSTSEQIANARNIATYRKMLHVNDRSVIVHAYQIMSHPVATINADISVKQAQEYFQNNLYNQLPVLTPQMHLVGLLTRMQVMQAYYQKPQIALAELISNDVITADPVSDIRRVASVMYDYKLPALPIVNEQDHLVGIVSKTDILKALMNDPPVSLWT